MHTEWVCNNLEAMCEDLGIKCLMAYLCHVILNAVLRLVEQVQKALN